HRRAPLPAAPQAPGCGRRREHDQDGEVARVLVRRRIVLRLFLRFYLLLMLPATAAFVLLMFVTDEVMTRINAEPQRARAASAFERAERIIKDSRVPDWRGRLKLIETTFNIEHQILPIQPMRDDWFMSGEEKEP